MTYDEIMAFLAAFDGTPADSIANNEFYDEFDDEFDTLHDDHLLPFGCKSYDEFADIDIYELLGKD